MTIVDQMTDDELLAIDEAIGMIPNLGRFLEVQPMAAWITQAEAMAKLRRLATEQRARDARRGGTTETRETASGPSPAAGPATAALQRSSL